MLSVFPELHYTCKLAPMAMSWDRSVQTGFNNSGFFGSFQHTVIAPQQTVRRSYWNIELNSVFTNPGQYPPGQSILRVGMGYFDDGLLPANTPTPISQPNDDWLDIETLAPDIILASATQNIWMLNWRFPKDESVKSQRKNETTSDMGLYVCWEFSLNGQVSGFAIQNNTSSLDALINTP